MNNTRSSVLSIYAAAVTLAVPAAIILGFAAADSANKRTRFTEIDIERINVIEPDGTLKFVISNSERQAEGTISGEPIPLDRERPAGMIFFNDDGDEVGGLVFGGDQQEGAVGLMMDQFKQDQVLALMHQEFTAPDGERRRMSGLMAWDRPKDITVIDMLERIEEAEAIEDPEQRAEAMQQLQEEGVLGTQRMFIGRSIDGNAGVFLNDGQSRPRLGLFVGQDGEAAIHFLDEDGEIVRTITAEDELSNEQ